MRAFFHELKRRRVYRVALAYGIFASAMIQVGGTILPIFHAPEWGQQVFVMLIAIGFPFALVLGGSTTSRLKVFDALPMPKVCVSIVGDSCGWWLLPEHPSLLSPLPATGFGIRGETRPNKRRMCPATAFRQKASRCCRFKT